MTIRKWLAGAVAVLCFASFPGSASAQSVADLLALIAQLQAQIAALQGQTSPNTIRLISPNGGETYEIGDTVEVRSSGGRTNDVGQISNSYFLVDSATGNAREIFTSGNSQYWTIGSYQDERSIAPGRYKMRVMSSYGPCASSDCAQTIQDDSDGTFTISAGDSSDVDSDAPLTVTAPNGGEEWEVGVMNSITWTPYGYDPDVNPSGDVVAYLEKRVRGGYQVVGKVMPSGKASIHWESDIDAYGKYPTPGQYYIRIENEETGESDRSDQPFTFTPRSVDVKVNGSNGPVSLRENQEVKVSWTTEGTFTSCLAMGVRAERSPYSYNIYDLPTKGSITAYYSGYPGGSIGISCEKNENVSRWDSVSVITSGTPIDSSVRVIKPNGGESIIIGSMLSVDYEVEGVNLVSLALYRNDQFYKWLGRDITPEDGASGRNTFTWKETESSLGNQGPVYKIYITGQRLDGEGYVDDKSDRPFSFTNESTIPNSSLTVVTSSLNVTTDGLRANATARLKTAQSVCPGTGIGSISWGDGTTDALVAESRLGCTSNSFDTISHSYRGTGTYVVTFTAPDRTTKSETIYVTSPQTTSPTFFGSVNSGTFDTENPTITGTANLLVQKVGISISYQGEKVYGSGPTIPVSNGRWSHKVTTDLRDGQYLVDLYSTTNVKIGSATITVYSPSTPLPADPTDDDTDTDTGTTPDTTYDVPTITFSSSVRTIRSADGATLTWSTTSANRCTMQSSDLGEISVGTAGSLDVYPYETTTYRLICSNEPGTGKDGPTAEKSVTVRVFTLRPGVLEASALQAIGEKLELLKREVAEFFGN